MFSQQVFIAIFTLFGFAAKKIPFTLTFRTAAKSLG
jgi:hypothetical protein